MAISTPPPLPPSLVPPARVGDSRPALTSLESPERPESGEKPAEKSDLERVRQLGEAKKQIIHELRKRIVGQDQVVELLLTCVFAHGHGLFVGVPGLAKTL